MANRRVRQAKPLAKPLSAVLPEDMRERTNRLADKHDYAKGVIARWAIKRGLSVAADDLKK